MVLFAEKRWYLSRKIAARWYFSRKNLKQNLFSENRNVHSADKFVQSVIDNISFFRSNKDKYANQKYWQNCNKMIYYHQVIDFFINAKIISSIKNLDNKKYVCYNILYIPLIFFIFAWFEIVNFKSSIFSFIVKINKTI